MTNDEGIPAEPADAGDDDESWPSRELLEVHELNELGAGITAESAEPESDDEGE